MDVPSTPIFHPISTPGDAAHVSLDGQIAHNEEPIIMAASSVQQEHMAATQDFMVFVVTVSLTKDYDTLAVANSRLPPAVDLEITPGAGGPRASPNVDPTILLLIKLLTRKEIMESARHHQQQQAVTLLQTRPMTPRSMTEDDDVFHCIDISLQPALSHPLLRNHTIHMKPSSYPSGIKLKSPSEATIEQAQLTTIACPVGTIPILQNSKSDLKTPFSFDPMDDTNKRGAEVAGCRTSGEIYGTQVSINIYEPKVYGNNDFSASWAMMTNGPNENLEAIAAGNIVWPNFLGDNFARFHIYWQVDGMKMPCFDHLCPGFVQVNESIGLGMKLQPVSVYNGKQYAIMVTISKDSKTKDWWLFFGDKKTPVGYWPHTLFKYMNDHASSSLWGGHVHGPTVMSQSPEMGSGHFAEEGFGKAAFVRDIKIVNENNEFVNPDTHSSYAKSTKEACYNVAKFGYNPDGMHVYFGGAGKCPWSWNEGMIKSAIG
ncbi:protein neprosin-like [Phragmites australis]|uniref:protein neprosin-like n=1 Tax=Phragmites australis TaxID=29695 RepID=UPI002D77774E|nr:protein neprosin-like [Phragmites australis]